MNEEIFTEQYLSNLNPQQQEAVRAVDGAILLLAVPGSGKTTVLINRLGYMVCCKGISPSSILTMTYTVAATEEMRQRFSCLFGDSYAEGLEFRTINGLSQKIISYYSSNYSAREIFTLETDEGAIFKRIRQIYLAVNKDYASESTVKDIRTLIAYIKNMLLSVEEIEGLQTDIDNMPEIYRRYCETMRAERRMDYDDQMTYALRILQKYPEILDHFQERYRYICVDEAQDTSKIQHKIIELLAQKYGNIFMVGDEDQSIYGFRAAYPEALLDFEKTYPKAKILLIEQNYRSSREIVDAANAFVVKNRFRHEKKIVETRGEICPVQVIDALDREAQIKYLLASAVTCSLQTAVLYRNNDSALPLIDLLERRGIGYNCRQFDGVFFSHIIVSDVSDIIRFAYDMTDAEIFLRIYYKLNVPIKKAAAEFAANQCRKEGVPPLKAVLDSPELAPYAKELVRELNVNLSLIKELSASQAVRMIFDTFGYGKYAESKHLDSTKREILYLLAKNVETPLDLLSRIDELREIILSHKNNPQNRFILSTVHSSKGLEYDRVFLLDIFDGILPLNPKPDAAEAEEIKLYEEERRLYYVAMTRAKIVLCLFQCRGIASAFTDETVRQLPTADMSGDSIWSSLTQNLCGKKYTHKLHGKGTVLAQNGMLLLLEYESGRLELSKVSELFDKRKLEYTDKSAAKKTRKPARSEGKQSTPVSIGSKITHNKFGKGTVTGFEDGIISIRFNKYGVKNFDYKAAVDKGNLSM